MQAVTDETINAYNEFSCELKCVAIMVASSILPRKEFFEKLKGSDPLLTTLGISPSRADKFLRVKLNKDILRPQNKVEIEKGAFTAATKASDVILRVCV